METASLDDRSSSPLSSDADTSFLTEPLLSAVAATSENLVVSDDYVPLTPPPSALQDCSPYVLDSRRYIVLTVYCLNNLLSSGCWITFAPIEDAVEVYYGGISADQVNWLSMIMMAVYGPGTLVCAWAIPKYGLRPTVVISSVLISIGALLRWWSVFFIDSDPSLAYIMVLSGQAIVGVGQTPFSNAPATVASAWFATTTNAIGASVLSGTVGMAIAQAMSPLLVDEADGAHLGQLLAGQTLAILLCTAATWWWFEAQPDAPPSAAEAARRQQSPSQVCWTSLKRDTCHLILDPQYQLLVAAFGIGYGVNNASLTILQPWMASSGYQGDAVAGLCGTLSIIGGTVGNLIASPLLDASQDFNRAVRWSFAVAFGVAIATVAALHVEAPMWLLGTVFFASGMSQLPLLTIAMDAAAAHSYPIPEDLSSAGLQLVGQYLGVGLTQWMGSLIASNGGTKGFAAPVNIAFVALLGLSSAFALCYNGDDPRAAANARRGNDVETARHEEVRSSSFEGAATG